MNFGVRFREDFRAKFRGFRDSICQKFIIYQITSGHTFQGSKFWIFRERSPLLKTKSILHHDLRILVDFHKELSHTLQIVIVRGGVIAEGVGKFHKIINWGGHNKRGRWKMLRKKWILGQKLHKFKRIRTFFGKTFGTPEIIFPKS